MRVYITAIEFAESITKLKSLLYHVAHEIEAPKYCRHGEDFGPDGINPCAPDCDTFQHFNCRSKVEEIDCGHDVKNFVGSLCREFSTHKTTITLQNHEWGK